MRLIVDEFSDMDDRGSIEGQRGWWDSVTFDRVAACPRELDHRYGPGGYLAWHHWADARRKTHRQKKCDCGLYLLMEKKAARRGTE